MTGLRGGTRATRGAGATEGAGTGQDPTSPRRIRVLVADDHPMWRDAVSRDLADAGFEVVATADDGPSAVARTRATRPDVLVLDLHLPHLTGAQVCAALVAADVPSRVLILSASGDHQDVLDAMKAGALGYLVKSAGRDEFLAAVSSTAAGEPVFTPGLAGLVLGEFRRVRTTGGAREVPELTERETEVLKYVATGMGYKQIAAALFLSHRTVQNHVQNILGKLHLHNRVELVRFAMDRGIDPAERGDRSAVPARAVPPPGSAASPGACSGCGPGQGGVGAGPTLSW